MKVLLGAAAAALLLASPALAQTPPLAPSCANLDVGAAPTLPDGATANASAMSETQTAFNTWHAAALEKLNPCRAELEAAQARLATLQATYNAAAGPVEDHRSAWEAEVNEFNARGEAGESTDRRRRGGVITRADD